MPSKRFKSLVDSLHSPVYVCGVPADNRKNGKVRGTNGGRRRGAAIKHTEPTTVRLTPENDAFVRLWAELHPGAGMTGAINDALELYRATPRIQKIVRVSAQVT